MRTRCAAGLDGRRWTVVVGARQARGKGFGSRKQWTGRKDSLGKARQGTMRQDDVGGGFLRLFTIAIRANKMHMMQ